MTAYIIFHYIWESENRRVKKPPLNKMNTRLQGRILPLLTASLPGRFPFSLTPARCHVIFESANTLKTMQGKKF